MSFPAFFDTNVLYGATLNDLLLWLADAGAFRPLWSADVLEELERNLVANGFDKTAIEHRIATMVEYFPDAMIDGYASAHIAALTTPGAAGKRYLLLADGPTTTFLEVADVLRAQLGEFASKVPTEEAPGRRVASAGHPQ
ncbi:MAG: PIN domain-containing protein [Actinomycetota bacterium]